jgi:hypothetical protein
LEGLSICSTNLTKQYPGWGGFFRGQVYSEEELDEGQAAGSEHNRKHKQTLLH